MTKYYFPLKSLTFISESISILLYDSVGEGMPQELCVMYCIGGTSLYRDEEGEQALLGPAHSGEEVVPSRAGAQGVIPKRIKCPYTLMGCSTP
jgi:hypothetical protein